MLPQAVLFCLCVAALMGSALAADEGRHSFSFAVLGDTPYFAWEALRLEQLLDELNGEDLAFVLHVGDIKSGRDRCDDDLYASRRALFQRSRHAFVLLPGDNDWTDCHRPNNGGFDPLERLERFRRVFYPDSLSLGQQPIRLERQSDDADYAAYRENVRWHIGAVLFAAVHVVGSGNNYSSAQDSEFVARSAANLAWLAQTFEQAESAHIDALVVAIHGNPLLEFAPGSPRRAGFDDFVQRLEEGATALGKPVLLVHGDTHRFRWDRPHPAFRRLESFGSPGVGWVHVTVHPDAPERFSVEPNP
jgi:hypothetical protein